MKREYWSVPIKDLRTKSARKMLLGLAAAVTGKTEDTVTAWDISSFYQHIELPKCFTCWDTGYMGAGPMAPLTKMPCGQCERGKGQFQMQWQPFLRDGAGQ